MKVKDLQAFLADFSPELEIGWGDPNFGGELVDSNYEPPTAEAFVYEDHKILIRIPQVDSLG